MAAVVKPASCVALSWAMLEELSEAISDEVSSAISEDFNPVIETVELTDNPLCDSPPKRRHETPVSALT
jgi:hypothetical protein